MMVVGVLTQAGVEMPVAVMADSRAHAHVLALISASATVARSDERPELRCAMIWTTPKSAGCIVFAKNAEMAVKSVVLA